MHNLAIKMTDYMIFNQSVDKDKRDQYVYVLEMMMGKILNYGTLLFLSLISKTLLSNLMFMIVFFMLRGRTGGFYARKVIHCFCGTCMIFGVVNYILSPYFMNHIENEYGVCLV